MISYQAVLTELEKHLQVAKAMSNEQQFREALVAIKALCDVVLQLPADKSQQQKVNQLASSALMTEPSIYHSNEAQPISSSQRFQEEDGANGESLFDF